MWACLTSRIVSLSLSDCINIADEAVGAVAQLLPSLYEFSLQVMKAVPQLIESNLITRHSCLSTLYAFRLSVLQAYHVTDSALSYFSPKQSHSLSILRLNSCWELTNHGIVNIGNYSESFTMRVESFLFHLFSVELSIMLRIQSE